MELPSENINLNATLDKEKPCEVKRYSSRQANERSLDGSKIALFS